MVDLQRLPEASQKLHRPSVRLWGRGGYTSALGQESGIYVDTISIKSYTSYYNLYKHNTIRAVAATSGHRANTSRHCDHLVEVGRFVIMKIMSLAAQTCFS